MLAPGIRLRPGSPSSTLDRLSRSQTIGWHRTLLLGISLSDPVVMTYEDGPASTVAPGGEKYSGLDAFGRVVETKWKKASAVKQEVNYGYDRASNRKWRRNELAHDDNGAEKDKHDNFYVREIARRKSEAIDKESYPEFFDAKRSKRRKKESVNKPKKSFDAKLSEGGESEKGKMNSFSNRGVVLGLFSVVLALWCDAGPLAMTLVKLCFIHSSQSMTGATQYQ